MRMKHGCILSKNKLNWVNKTNPRKTYLSPVLPSASVVVVTVDVVTVVTDPVLDNGLRAASRSLS